MDMQQKITLSGVLSEGISIGIKNLASLLIASLLWLVTIWIPYLNVGTTIAMTTIPIELSKGRVISPLFIFDAKYRKYMGEFFTLKGMMWMAIFPASLFMIVPGMIISLGWSLSLFILLDKGVAPGEAMIRSNKATYGYKWIIFGVGFVLGIIFMLLLLLLCQIPYIGLLLAFLVVVVFMVARLGCNAVIYRDLVGEDADESAM